MNSIDKLIGSPSLHFSSPLEIVSSDKLASDQKMRALENWKDMLSHIQNGEGEGMNTAGRDISIKQINKAIYKLRLDTL